MAHERRRAALAALCVVAVAFAATLLPASGFGSQPAGVGVGGDGPDAPPSGGTGPDDPGSTAEPNPRTSTPEDSMTATTSGSSEDSAPTEPTETTTTQKETTTEAAGSGVGDSLRELLATVALTALGLVGVLGLFGFWTGALAVSSAAAGPLPFTVTIGGRPIGELVGAIPTRTMALVVGFSASVPRLLDDAATLTREVGHSVGTVVGGLARGTGEALRVGAQGLAVTFTAIPRALAGLGAGAGVLSSLGGGGLPSLGRGGDGGDSGRRGPTAGSAEPEETGPPSVEEAWETLRDRVPVRNRDARTPGEVARTAARRGYPNEAVRRLTDAFREVRYGDLPRDDRTDSARSALDRLRDHWRDDE